VGTTGYVSAFPNPHSAVIIESVARHYLNNTIGINLLLKVSNPNDFFNLRTPEILSSGYHGNFGKYRFKFYMGDVVINPGIFETRYRAIRGIELYDSNNFLIQTIPFETITNRDNYSIYGLKGTGADIASGEGEINIPYPNFDPDTDTVGIEAITFRAYDLNGSGTAIDTTVTAQSRPFDCTKYWYNNGARNEVIAPHNNMYIMGFVETYADGHIRADASSGGMGNTVTDAAWIRTQYDYTLTFSRDGVAFRTVTYSYEHTPAVPFSNPTVFELPASQVPAGNNPVTMRATLVGTVYNLFYTETLISTIDTTLPDGTKFPGDNPPPVPVFGRLAYIGECNGDIPNACTNQWTFNGWRW
jgi:hypothetical protein